MSDEHQHLPGQPDPHQPATPPDAGGPDEDAGSRALSDALRSSFFIVQVVMVLLVVLFLTSGFFTVGPQERKVVLRFGKTVGSGDGALLGPGWHWAFPPPIDEVVRIPFAQSLTVSSTVGWYRLTPDEAAGELQGIKPRGRPSLDPSVDGYTLVGDGNIVHARAILTYRVQDPIRYEFDFVAASNSVQNALDNALVYASAKFTNVDDVLRRERARFQETVRARVDDLVQEEKLGIKTEQCQVDEVPPLILAEAFDGVTSALASVEQILNSARSAQIQGTNAAATEARRIINAAETDRRQLITNLEADVKQFNDLEPMYRTNAELVRNIYLLPAIGRIMTNVGGKWFIPATPENKYEIRLQTGPDYEAPRPLAPADDMENRLP
jgi:membrane protease subunit HflK